MGLIKNKLPSLVGRKTESPERQLKEEMREEIEKRKSQEQEIEPESKNEITEEDLDKNDKIPDEAEIEDEPDEIDDPDDEVEIPGELVKNNEESISEPQPSNQVKKDKKANKEQEKPMNPGYMVTAKSVIQGGLIQTTILSDIDLFDEKVGERIEIPVNDLKEKNNKESSSPTN